MALMILLIYRIKLAKLRYYFRPCIIIFTNCPVLHIFLNNLFIALFSKQSLRTSTFTSEPRRSFSYCGKTRLDRRSANNFNAGFSWLIKLWVLAAGFLDFLFLNVCRFAPCFTILDTQTNLILLYHIEWVWF